MNVCVRACASVPRSSGSGTSPAGSPDTGSVLSDAPPAATLQSRKHLDTL